MTTTRIPTMERAMGKVCFEPMSGCWLWTGSLGDGRYGQISSGKKMLKAHRVVYEALVGPIPDGMQLDHLCRNTACVCPDHLQPVDARTNVRRSKSPMGLNASKIECKNGHPFDDVNTYRMPDGNRACRPCRSAHRRNFVSRKGME